MPSDKPAIPAAPLSSKEQTVALIVSSSYILLTLARPWLRSALFGYEGELTVATLDSHAVAYFGPTIVTGLIPLCLILFGVRAGWLPRLRETGTIDISHWGTVAIVLCGSYVLAGLGIWPFTWQGSDSTTPLLACWAKSGIHLLVPALWALHAVVVAPIIEEWVFRRWLPLVLAQLQAPMMVTLLVPSALFALAHLGTIALSSFTAHSVVQMGWLFLGSIVLTYGMVRWQWRLGGAMVAHGSRNAADLLFLLLARC